MHFHEKHGSWLTLTLGASLDISGDDKQLRCRISSNEEATQGTARFVALGQKKKKNLFAMSLRRTDQGDSRYHEAFLPQHDVPSLSFLERSGSGIPT